MALPKLDTPTFQITLPLSKKPITFRPYLTKEEKILLMAVESKDPKQILSAIRQVANNCIVEPIGFDIDSLPMVDLDYLFLQLRSKSKGEVLDAQFSCKATLADSEEAVCGNVMNLTVKIDELKVEIPPGFVDTIALTDTVGIKMRLPRYKDVVQAQVREGLTGIEKSFEIIKSSIESIYDKDQIFEVKPGMDKDVEEFLGSLNHEQFEKITEMFFVNLPRINYVFNTTCPKCKFEHHIDYKDIASFF